jgi:hypothetical protein
VATQAATQPRPPRRPTLCYCQGEIPDEVLAVMRLNWYKHGRVKHVEEAQLMECDDGLLVLQHIVNEALDQGVDVTLICAYAPEDVGLVQTSQV